MTHHDTHIQTCQNSVIQMLSKDPSKGRSTKTITGQVTDGLHCSVTQGRHEIAMDMGIAMGGTALAPSPGIFAKAGLVGCLAIATKMTAARDGINLRSVRVDVETDTDDLAVFGLGGGNAAPLDTRIKITVDSDAPDALVDDLIARVLTIDTWFLALRDAQKVSVDWRRLRPGDV